MLASFVTFAHGSHPTLCIYLPSSSIIMYGMRTFTTLSAMLLVLVALPAIAQDLHFSQFYLHPQHMSPASAGGFQGTLRASGIYRSQWRTVPVDYKTYGLAADWKAIQAPKSEISLGLILQQDQAGDARLSWTQGGLNFSAGHKIGQNSRLAAGFGISALQRSIDLGQLTFKNQWNGDNFDPNLASREPFSRSSGLTASLSAGLHFSAQAADSRSGLKIAMGAFHLNRPELSFGGIGEARLPIRWSIWTEGMYEWSSQTDWWGYGAFQYMNQAQELVLGAGIRQFINNGLADVTAVRISLGWRSGDAIIPAVQLERNNWLAGFSYDINLSEFEQATRGRGGPELALVYRLVPVEISKVVKCCPVF